MASRMTNALPGQLVIENWKLTHLLPLASHSSIVAKPT